MIVYVLLGISLMLNVACLRSLDKLYRLRGEDFMHVWRIDAEISQLEWEIKTIQTEDIAYLREKVTNHD